MPLPKVFTQGLYLMLSSTDTRREDHEDGHGHLDWLYPWDFQGGETRWDHSHVAFGLVITDVLVMTPAMVITSYNQRNDFGYSWL
ncbi:hypothetical protein VKT23_002750 [Stygiomarasmius scandens]|uniref:Uncharacterized protein n=1 Tax=Marasmiellus scandens TaxID=2682957 RepID=A0ABR1JV65_9AGAR